MLLAFDPLPRYEGHAADIFYRLARPLHMPCDGRQIGGGDGIPQRCLVVRVLRPPNCVRRNFEKGMDVSDGAIPLAILAPFHNLQRVRPRLLRSKKT